MKRNQRRRDPDGTYVFTLGDGREVRIRPPDNMTQADLAAFARHLKTVRFGDN